MITHILRFEWKNLRADVLVRVFVLIFAILISYAFYTGYDRVKQHEGSIQEVLEKERAFYSELRADLIAIEKGEKNPPRWFEDPRDPYRAGFIRGAGVHVYFPASELGLLASGQSDIYAAFIKVPRNEFSVDLENPYKLASGEFDPAFVLVFLLPLFIIGLSYNVLSAEREQGTLRLILSQPVTAFEVLVPKVLIRFLLVWLTTVASLVLGFGALNDNFFPLGLASVVLFLTLYIAFWFAVALLINLFSRNSTTNLTILSGIWILFTLIIPTLVNLTANTIHPVPSRVAYVNSIRSASQEAAKKREEILREYYGDERELMSRPASEKTIRETTLENLQVNRYAEILVAETESEYQRKLENQQALVDAYMFLSPSLVLYRALSKSAGTDGENYKAFKEVAENFKVSWENYFLDRYERGDVLGPEDYDQFPVYNPDVSQFAIGADAKYGIGLGLFLLIVIVLVYAFSSRKVLVS